MKKKPSKKAPEKKMKPLPKTFRGTDVVRGVGMKADDYDRFLEKKALDSFDATREMWIVLENDALEDLDNVVEVKGFADKAEAVATRRPGPMETSTTASFVLPTRSS